MIKHLNTIITSEQQNSQIRSLIQYGLHYKYLWLWSLWFLRFSAHYYAPTCTHLLLLSHLWVYLTKESFQEKNLQPSSYYYQSTYLYHFKEMHKKTLDLDRVHPLWFEWPVVSYSYIKWTPANLKRIDAGNQYGRSKKWCPTFVFKLTKIKIRNSKIKERLNRGTNQFGRDSYWKNRSYRLPGSFRNLPKNILHKPNKKIQATIVFILFIIFIIADFFAQSSGKNTACATPIQSIINQIVVTSLYIIKFRSQIFNCTFENLNTRS